ncbi:retinoid-inducible serine carboxypeptidase-like isoform X2 [Leptopilina boulardi]|nr:retinoid-inducible serine carboxypeptidase-like isoform X2 [Leptopilina boulardi]
MFYWLYYTTANVTSYTEKPLLIWLEGGPGIPSTGYTNFQEIGPLTLNLTTRDNSLVKDYNILFIDSPVGTGFSNVNTENKLARTEQQVINDLIILIEQFFMKFSILSKVQTYIVGTCYGGRTAAALAYEWIQKIEKGWNITNLKGVGLSSAWISPVDSALGWAPYLYQNGIVDDKGYKAIMNLTKQIKYKIKTKDWRDVYDLFINTINEIPKYVGNVNLYNIFSRVNNHHFYAYYAEDNNAMKILMESKVKSALNLPENSYYEPDLETINKRLAVKIMKPITKKVEYLLNQNNFKVFVFNGQFDLIVNSQGTFKWVKNLSWNNSAEWLAARREPLIINDFIEGYVKSYGNLRMYWVNRAGHATFVDNPVAVREILHRLTDDDNNDDLFNYANLERFINSLQSQKKN